MNLKEKEIEQQLKLENLAITLKCIIDCERPQFKVRNLANMAKLEGYFFNPHLRSLRKNGYLTIKKGSVPKYSVKSFEKLKAYYEEIKNRVSKEFVELVLEEG